MSKKVSDTFSAILEFFFPSSIYCAACGNLIDRTRPYALCDGCIREIEWHTHGVKVCAICGKALSGHRAGGICADCREWGRSFDAGISCCTYGGRARDMVRAMKYRDSAWIAGKIADCMYDRWKQLSASEGAAPVIVPAPMTEAKMQKRGYDQARLIARKFAYLTGAALAEGLLLRIKDTSVMSGLGAYERRANMAGAFALDPYALRLIDKGKMLIGDVILIDDVLTTGSTADACASTLKEAGAGKITLFTFAAGADIDISRDESGGESSQMSRRSEYAPCGMRQ